MTTKKAALEALNKIEKFLSSTIAVRGYGHEALAGCTIIRAALEAPDLAEVVRDFGDSSSTK
jgi:hypothetical protein